MKTSDRPALAGNNPTSRRPYETPAIEETAPFETLALACASNQGQCIPPYGEPTQYDNS